MGAALVSFPVLVAEFDCCPGGFSERKYRPLRTKVNCGGANKSARPAGCDGAGGVFVAWSDQRTPTGGGDMYVQHILADDALDPAWPAEALPLCTLPNSQMYPTLVDDGTGGARARDGGVGLQSMRERAEELGGRLVVDSGPAGTAVRLQLPR